MDVYTREAAMQVITATVLKPPAQIERVTKVIIDERSTNGRTYWNVQFFGKSLGFTLDFQLAD